LESGARFSECGFYTLPGHIFDPTQAIDEIVVGEQLGLGSVWISERFGGKSGEVISGAAAILSAKMGIASGLLQNLPLRHPIVVAGYAATMAKLTQDRFALGVGRGTDQFADSTGTPRLTFQVLEDYIGILRRLWRGETVDYEGRLGRIRGLRLGVELERSPPIIMAAMGEKTCRWAGGLCDGVLFNSLWTPEAVARSVRAVREGAEQAGRDPSSVRIWTIQVTACEVPEELMLSYVVRRMNTYLLFPPMFEAICKANGWDAGAATGLRSALAELDKERRAGTMGDEATTREIDDLRRMRDLYPREWLYEGNAVGSARECAQATRARFDAGADGVLFHGCHPRDLRPLLELWPHYRPSGIAHRPVNPGR
jgi:5,10-methylenetetrahydromethanopterin reductase